MLNKSKPLLVHACIKHKGKVVQQPSMADCVSALQVKSLKCSTNLSDDTLLQKLLHYL